MCTEGGTRQTGRDRTVVGRKLGERLTNVLVVYSILQYDLALAQSDHLGKVIGTRQRHAAWHPYA
jgi:hypothetical protein